MARLVWLAALGALLGSCGTRSAAATDVDDPGSRRPPFCRNTSWHLGAARVEQWQDETDRASGAREYRLDLDVHMRRAGGVWLVVGLYGFIPHVHDLRRHGDDWVFEGDGGFIRARWLEGPGDLVVRDVRTKARQPITPVALDRISLGGVPAQEWIRQGGDPDGRSTGSAPAVPVTLDVVCFDWLELPPPATDGGS